MTGRAEAERYCGGRVLCGGMFCAELAGWMFWPVACGSILRAPVVGSIVRAVLCGAIVFAELEGWMLRTVVEGNDGGGAGATGGGAGVTAAVGVTGGGGGTAGAGDGAGLTVGVVDVVAAAASPAVMEMRPRLAATVSLVMTRALDALRLVRFASATSGESSADTKPAMRHTAMIVRSMMKMIRPPAPDSRRSVEECAGEEMPH